MRKSIGLFVLSLALGCTSTSVDDPASGPRGPIEDQDADWRMSRRAMAAAGLEMMPPPRWWRDREIAGEVGLSSDQVDRLEDLYRDYVDDLSRMERDSSDAARELRRVLESDDPRTDEILDAGERVREARNAVFDRQLRILAAQRELLSERQWRTLMENLDLARSLRRDDFGPRRRGGRYPRPGYPPF